MSVKRSATMISRGVAGAALLLLGACGTTREAAGPGQPHYKIGQPYSVNGKTYHPREDPAYEAVGVASWYGDAFDGRRTANGEIFDKRRLSAAHTTMPLPSVVEVENLENGRRVVVRVNDRGPFVDDRLIDLSHAAARALGFDQAGLARVRVRYLGRAELADLAPIYGDRAAPRVAATRAPAAPAVMAMAPVDTPPAGVPPSNVTRAPDVETTLLGPASVSPIQAPPAQAAAITQQALPPLDALQSREPELVRSEYWITVAQFFGLSELEGAMEKLSSYGGVRMISDSGGVGYRLQMGPYPDEASANATLAVLREAGYRDALVGGERCYEPPAGSNLATC